MKGLLYVAAGGALGSGARYLLSLVALRTTGVTLWGTLAVNVVGSFAISVLAALVLAQRASEELRLLLGVGVLGGFTTYSSFNLETLTLWSRGAFGEAAGYVLATVVLSLVAGVTGNIVGRLLTSG